MVVWVSTCCPFSCLQRLLQVGYLTVEKHNLHVFVDVELFWPEVHDLVWIAKRLLHLVGAHPNLDSLALDGFKNLAF